MAIMGFLRNENNNMINAHIPSQDFQHIAIEGATGSGKTTSLILPILDDRMKNNNAIVFLEYKGHEHRKIKALASKEGRLTDIVELGKPSGTFINILELFDSNMINAIIIKMCGGEGKDPYWSTSAAQLTVRIIELQRKFQTVSNILVTDFSFNSDIFTLYLEDIKKTEYNTLKVSEEISFATLSKITKTPRTLISFFNKLEIMSHKIDIIIKGCLTKYGDVSHYDMKLKTIISEFILFQELVEKYANFVIEDSSEGSGNNGVLQILNNAIATLSTQAYFNENEIDILKVIDNNGIVIIDTQSVSTQIYGHFIEALLQKLSARIKHETPKKVAIFIDEANRALTQNIDLQNDVLRESKVELILSFQNENQMIQKFGKVKWLAFLSNIKHQYYISINHDVYHNDACLPKVEPMIFTEDEMNTSEYLYNFIQKNKEHVINRFIYDGSLPEYYTIVYDLHKFFQKSILELHAKNGDKLSIRYVGSRVKSKTLNQIKKYTSVVSAVEYRI